MAIETWRQSLTHDLREVQKLFGKLLHVSLVLPEGRAYITSLEHMIAIFGATKTPFAKVHPLSGCASELSWWKHLLSSPLTPRCILGPFDAVDTNAFWDTSSSVGIGICIGDRWCAWKLHKDWKRPGRDIGWAEAVGFELLVIALFHHNPTNQHLVIYGDNQGVVEGWRNKRSHNAEVNIVF